MIIAKSVNIIVSIVIVNGVIVYLDVDGNKPLIISKASGRVRVYGELSKSFRTQSGVRQGCPITLHSTLTSQFTNVCPLKEAGGRRSVWLLIIIVIIIIIIIDSTTSLFNTDASLPYNHDSLGSIITFTQAIWIETGNNNATDIGWQPYLAASPTRHSEDHAVPILEGE
ncbi:hypothetical protein T265_09204 [Opisthorchis viverrini]|uniref:Uncharacterized protein n=1 Tax=Opisthorchis viverrini TaxID=6198 RepID=A0A075A5R6_OPIVI|nr:hypothetical protein T265_09204 [Opisthorchis viverrini]KER22759.1 hypothetical protein T265_09204 [Opisthorchis viverrini]